MDSTVISTGTEGTTWEEKKLQISFFKWFYKQNILKIIAK